MPRYLLDTKISPETVPAESILTFLDLRSPVLHYCHMAGILWLGKSYEKLQLTS